MTNAAKEPAEQALNAALALFMAIILNWNADSCPKELRPPPFPQFPLAMTMPAADGNAMSADGYA